MKSWPPKFDVAGIRVPLLTGFPRRVVRLIIQMARARDNQDRLLRKGRHKRAVTKAWYWEKVYCRLGLKLHRVRLETENR